jgi:hypothetical protein
LKCSHSLYPDNPKTNTFAGVVPAFSHSPFRERLVLSSEVP